MKALKIDDKRAFKLYPTASPEFKAMLEDTFGKEFFSQNIIDRVTCVDDLFEIGGKKLEDIVLPTDSKDEAAYKLLKFGIAVLNEGVKIDHGDKTQYKYEPYFIYKPGVGLSFHCYGNWRTVTDCGPRLCYLSYDKMMHGIKIMEKWYNDYLN